MKMFPTQEIGSLPKATPELMERWGGRIGLAATSASAPLTERRSMFNLAFLRRAGLDFLFDGEAHRIEMAEHPYRAIRGAEFIGHVRSFDNKYFRKAAVREPPAAREMYHHEEFVFLREHSQVPLEALKIPVTGPYTLADWAYNDYYLSREPDRYRRAGRERAQRELVLALARDVLRPALADLVSMGARLVQIDEPALGTHPEETALAVEGFEESVKGLEAEFTIHICFSDYRKMFPAILEARSCREWAWEFANRDSPGHDAYELLRLFREHKDTRRIGLGVLDVHRDEVETPQLVADRIARAARHLGDASRIRVNPDCGLRTRSWDVIWAKLSNMVAGAELARTQAR